MNRYSYSTNLAMTNNAHSKSEVLIVCSRSLDISLHWRMIAYLQVGSGPSGLILALSLVRNGVPVRVIEKTITDRIGQRGAGLSVHFSIAIHL